MAGRTGDGAKPDHAREDDADVRREFAKSVNMSATELQKWLQTDESREVGWTHEGDHESVGHHSGRRIVELLHTHAAELKPDDLAHMRDIAIRPRLRQRRQ